MEDNLLVDEAGVKIYADHPVTPEMRQVYETERDVLYARCEETGEDYTRAYEGLLTNLGISIHHSTFDPDAD